MIKVNFSPKNNHADVNIEYDDFIPFTIKIGERNYLPDTIYTRNIYNENFLEFRFESESKKLYEITAVGIDFINVIKIEQISFLNSFPLLYECYFSDENISFLFSEMTHVYKDKSSIKIEWNSKGDMNYYNISEQCTIGVNSSGELACLIINNIETDMLNSIFI